MSYHHKVVLCLLSYGHHATPERWPHFLSGVFPRGLGSFAGSAVSVSGNLLLPHVHAEFLHGSWLPGVGGASVGDPDYLAPCQLV